MTQINWGIASGPTAFDNALTKGLQLGSAVRQQREESEYKNALAKVYGGGQTPQTQPQTPAMGGGIVATPGQEAQSAAVDQRLGTQGMTVSDSRVDPAALAVIAQKNPALAQSIQKQEQERRERAEVGQLTQDAMGNDPERKATALTQLATKYFDRFQALDKRERDATVAKDKQHGGVALYALQSPNPRSVVQDYAQRSGDPEIAALLQLPDDQLAAGLREKVFEADLAGKMIELERPSYQAVPYESTLVNTRDPAAVQAFLGGGSGPGAQPAASVPPAAVEALRRGEGTPEQFDQMFGPGAAARAMGQGGAGASRIGSNFLDGI